MVRNRYINLLLFIFWKGESSNLYSIYIMDSLRELYKIGNGPSSSHTMGPKKAAGIFLVKNQDADKFIVELYGSLALTGKGHLTDYAIIQTLGDDKTEVIFKPEILYDYHSNGLKFFAYKNDILIDEWLVFSVGGGTIKELNENRNEAHINYYKHKNMNEILIYCNDKNIDLYQYVIECEGESILDYAHVIVDAMFQSVERGINTRGVLPGKLKVKRRASDLYEKYLESKNFDALVFSCSLAASEENASGGVIVTAPTCGSCGVLPGVMYSYYKEKNYTIEQITKAILVGGLIGNIVKRNASISGAEVGCQGEVGTACSMTSASLAYLKGGTNLQIEYAAEIALEHHLGMTCDPVGGYVQIPCIERNAISAKRAIDSASYAMLTSGDHFITLDSVIDSMNETGKDINLKYKETSLGGLAKHIK